MQSIKFYKKYDTHLAKIGDTEYKGYAVGDLPPSFGFKEKYIGQDEDGNDQYKFGQHQWFNYKGLTYIEKTDLPW